MSMTEGHMNTLKRSQAIALQTRRELCAANAGRWSHSSLARSRSLRAAKRRRERILACLAFIMLIVAWDATLRLDEQMSPPRMRMSHAVEVDGELQMRTSVE
jgi:hypothetical protein